METKELKIQIPEGYEIDREKSTFEKIIFKKKDTKPRSWEEYCKQQLIKGAEGYLIDSACANIDECCWSPYGFHSSLTWKNVLPSKELAEAFLAMMQLMSLRQAWIGDWKPDYTKSPIYGIVYDQNPKFDEWPIGPRAFSFGNEHSIIPLTFPTMEMAQEFCKCFKDLLEIAKPLI